MTAVDVHVNADHIGRGVAGDCKRCPIALAIEEIFPHLVVQVGMTSVTLSLPYVEGADVSDLDTVTLPKAARDFINNFDHPFSASSKPAAPFSFLLEVSEACFQKGEHHGTEPF